MWDFSPSLKTASEGFSESLCFDDILQRDSPLNTTDVSSCEECDMLFKVSGLYLLFIPHLIEHDRNAVIVLSRVFYDLIMTNDNDNANQQAKERLCPLFIKGSLHMYSNQALCFKSLLSQRIIHPVCSFFQYLVTFIHLTHWHFYSWVFFFKE